jgi:hypothetical protein
VSKLICAALASIAASACSITPADGADWTDARVRAASDQPPVYIERVTLDPGVAFTLTRGAEDVLDARDRVQARAARLEAPTVDTADFVVRARERASPPPL